MDQAVTAVLAEYDARARNEQELMREVAAATVGRRLNDLLLHVGPKTGGLLNLLVREPGPAASWKLALLTAIRRSGSRRPREKPEERSLRSRLPATRQNMPVAAWARPGVETSWISA
jgi:hypothetical protein